LRSSGCSASKFPKRAQYIRVLFCEIGRLLNHLLQITTHKRWMSGRSRPPLWGFEEREKLMIFYERVSGARLHANYFRTGGVHQDMPAGLAEDIYAFCESFPKVVDDIDELLTENRIFKQRNVDIGAFSRKDAEAWGFTGRHAALDGPRLGSAPRPALRVLFRTRLQDSGGQERRLL